MFAPKTSYPDSDSEQSFKSLDDNEPPNPQTRSSSRTAPPHTKKSTTPPPPPQIERFPPEEEATLVAESNTLKTSANTLFGQGSYDTAIQAYDRALAACPNYLDFELAVLRSNIAACHVKLEAWKEAVTSAEQGLECLERLEPLPRVKATKPRDGKQDSKDSAVNDDDDEGVEEVDDVLAARIENLRLSGRTLDQVRKLQVKLLLRRARARVGTGGWAGLQGADEDYKTLLLPSMAAVLTASDRRTVVDASRRLGPQLTAARDQEMAEMMGKLKGLGNSLLKPFGLSTENFQFTKDDKSGGYSMNFNQTPGK